MSNPRWADGQPIGPGLTAVLDETVPQVGAGVVYVVATALILDPTTLQAALSECLPVRVRPFHWHKEGPVARDALLGCLERHGVVAHVLASSTGRKGQTRARAELIRATIPKLVDDGVDHLVIESRGERDDGRDRGTILDFFREGPGPGVSFAYDWRSKKEPVLWLADAVGGAVHEHLTGRSDEALDRLRDGKVVEEIIYL